MLLETPVKCLYREWNESSHADLISVQVFDARRCIYSTPRESTMICHEQSCNVQRWEIWWPPKWTSHFMWFPCWLIALSLSCIVPIWWAVPCPELFKTRIVMKWLVVPALHLTRRTCSLQLCMKKIAESLCSICVLNRMMHTWFWNDPRLLILYGTGERVTCKLPVADDFALVSEVQLWPLSPKWHAWNSGFATTKINKHLHVFLFFFLSRLFSYVQLLKSFSLQDIHVLCLCQGCVKVRALSVLLKVSGPPKEHEVWPSTSCWQLLASWLFDQWPGLPFQITDVH